MSKFATRKLKIVAVMSSVALFATAFTPGGCTINVDQELLNQLGGLLGGGGGPGPGGPGGWGPGDDWDHGGPHDWEQDFDDKSDDESDQE